jgi:fructose-bisphosphate aldolase class I
MLAKVASSEGFIAALDQSGGSTPKALKAYGIDASAWNDDAGMFDVVHAMRTRIMTSPVFDGTRILGAILFEGTMDREVEGLPTARYLWEQRGIVPFVKCDQGLADEADGAQLMRPMPALDALLERARAQGVFGTKMRSVIKLADPAGVHRVVAQQFEVAGRILDERYTRLLMERSDLDLGQVMLLDRVQKEQRISRDEHRRLKAAGLVEGRYPNLFVAAAIAKATGGAS